MRYIGDVAMPDAPSPPISPDPTRRSSRRLLAIIGGVVAVLAGVFGYMTLKHRNDYREYRERTIESGALPWDTQPFSVAECVEHATDWGLACPGLESWCLGDAPRVTLMCLQSAERTHECAAFGEDVRTNHFGYEACEALREDVQGRYKKRGHKKYCAANYRAVAEYCQQKAEAPAP